MSIKIQIVTNLTTKVRVMSFFVPGKKYFAKNYVFTLKKIESVVVVVVVVVKSSERFKALPIELES